jgi:regulator of sigma E protease
VTILLIAEVVLAFGFMIFIHEWGHFIACRLFGVRVERFALGFGPKLWARKWGDTEYAVLAVPLGGYCRPAGGDLSGESPEKMYENPPKPGEFLFASWWKRVLIFLSGPVMNYASAVFIIVALLVAGEKVPVEKPIMGFVPPGSLAEKAGLQKGDVLLEAKGKAIQNLYTDFDVKLEDIRKGVPLVVDRGGRRLHFTLQGDLKEKGALLGLYASVPPILGDVHLTTPARKAGLRPGDEILSVNGRKVAEWTELAYCIRNANTDEVKLEVKRADKVYPVTVKRIFNGMNKAIGISPPEGRDFVLKKMPVWEAVPAALERSAGFTVLFLGSIWKLVTLEISLKDNIAGPVTILRTMYQKAAQSWAEFLNTVALISLILCLMNLLPIPVVDGGQMVLCALEGLKRSPVSVKFQLVYQQVGFIFVIALMAVAVFNDVWSLVMETFKSQIP